MRTSSRQMRQVGVAERIISVGSSKQAAGYSVRVRSARHWVHPCHICTGTWSLPCHICTATWAHPCHICTGLDASSSCVGTRLALSHIYASTGLTPATLHRDWAHPAHICSGTGLTLLAFDDLFRRCGRQMTRNMRRGGRDTWRLTAET